MTTIATFLLVSNDSDDYWYQILEQALSPFGSLLRYNEEDSLSFISQQNSQQNFALIIIDAAAVSDAVCLVSCIRAQNCKTKIVVVTASPTWKQARDLFYAGANDYMRKLPDQEEISTSLQALINTPQGE